MKPEEYCAAEYVYALLFLLKDRLDNQTPRRSVSFSLFFFFLFNFNMTFSCCPQDFPNLDEIMRCLDFVLILGFPVVTAL